MYPLRGCIWEMYHGTAKCPFLVLLWIELLVAYLLQLINYILLYLMLDCSEFYQIGYHLLDVVVDCMNATIRIQEGIPSYNLFLYVLNVTLNFYNLNTTKSL